MASLPKVEPLRVYTLQEAAEFARCAPNTLAAAVKDGRLRAQRIGRGLERKHYRITGSELLKFLGFTASDPGEAG